VDPTLLSCDAVCHLCIYCSPYFCFRFCSCAMPSPCRAKSLRHAKSATDLGGQLDGADDHCDDGAVGRRFPAAAEAVPALRRKEAPSNTTSSEGQDVEHQPGPASERPQWTGRPAPSTFHLCVIIFVHLQTTRTVLLCCLLLYGSTALLPLYFSD